MFRVSAKYKVRVGLEIDNYNLLTHQIGIGMCSIKTKKIAARPFCSNCIDPSYAYIVRTSRFFLRRLDLMLPTGSISVELKDTNLVIVQKIPDLYAEFVTIFHAKCCNYRST